MKDHRTDDWNDTARRAAIGAAGGLAGLVAFRAYWKLAELVHGTDVRMLRDRSGGLAEEDVNEQLQRGRVEATGDTVRMAEGKANPAPPDERTRPSSYAVHWSYPIMIGAAYGAAREPTEARVVEGLIGGATLWASVDEVIAPLVGTRSGKAVRPFAHHVHRLISHAVLGTVVVVATEALHNALPRPPKTRRERAMRAVTSTLSSVKERIGLA